MNTKQMVWLGAAAAILCGAAYYLNHSAHPAAPRLNGTLVFPKLDVSKVARIEVGDKLVLKAGESGWTIETAYGYPASREKIVENLMKLTELKVGQVVRGKTAAEASVMLALKSEQGEDLVAPLALGDRHAKWGHGRYAKKAGETVLLSDSLDAFDGDMKSWCEDKICDDPFVRFSSLVDPADTTDFGFATGVVCRVQFGGDTNLTATVGATVAGSSDRYFKVGDGKWVYTIPSYAAESVIKKAEPKQN